MTANVAFVVGFQPVRQITYVCTRPELLDDVVIVGWFLAVERVFIVMANLLFRRLTLLKHKLVNIFRLCV